ncbi:MAG: UTP--glucose-1-phosphate uridylyltransferase [Deltaproteobacteria bacterium]|nr:UTP--glucose-1-phosphate uridylyltransferase [Deltaproteobacteria bacterium]
MTEFKEIEQILASQGTTTDQISLFSDLYYQFLKQKKEPLDWDKISTPADESIIPYESLETVDSVHTKGLLEQLAVCRLNGGLGTSMGCVGPKSAIEVRNNQTFLDLIVTQINTINQKYGVNVPLILMNSFNTDQDTNKIIRKYDDEVLIHTFKQNEFNRLRKDSWLPLSAKKYGASTKYPPGHGDFYNSIGRSGILDSLIEQGKKYMYIANADNLGASVDFKILHYLDRSNTDFIMEVTEKTRADVKGGTLVRTDKQTLKLLEFAQVPEEYREEFKSIKKFKIFNTNNIWINLVALRNKLDSKSLVLDVFENFKQVNRLPVVQLETAIGGGINCFKNSKAIQVPRIRFLPVKTTNDLLLIQSNLFILDGGVLKRNQSRHFENLPLIRLGEFYRTIDDYKKRISMIPDILELDHLTVVGDVYFGKKTKLCGNVILVCERGELHIPDQSFLENKVMTGNIRIGEL